MTKYENQSLKNEVLVMEDCFFLNCVLTDCDVFYSGGDVEWTNVQFQACRWHFRNAALKTIQLARNLGMMKELQTLPQGPVSSSKMN
jgi:hypothetical protein